MDLSMLGFLSPTTRYPHKPCHHAPRALHAPLQLPIRGLPTLVPRIPREYLLLLHLRLSLLVRLSKNRALATALLPPLLLLSSVLELLLPPIALPNEPLLTLAIAELLQVAHSHLQC